MASIPFFAFSLQFFKDSLILLIPGNKLSSHTFMARKTVRKSGLRLQILSTVFLWMRHAVGPFPKERNKKKHTHLQSVIVDFAQSNSKEGNHGMVKIN